MTAKQILENPDYLAISYGGYRQNSRSQTPSLEQIKEDLLILAAMSIKILRTYNTGLEEAAVILSAIQELKKEQPGFEMYVMVGAWINCKGAFGNHPDHEGEDAEENAAEIDRAIRFAQQYPDIVKVIAVGNEAMVKWAASYFVQPRIILKYVNQLQELKKAGKLPADLWITSSDNFASWGGGGSEYHTPELTNLLKAVDYVSMHTYPMHDTHYNPVFWGNFDGEEKLSKKQKIQKAMERAIRYAENQYQSVMAYMKRLGIYKPVHIGESGWASQSNELYGNEGSRATDEFKEGLYYQLMRTWTRKNKIACFYFEAFDEIWKDAANPGGSENHFGLLTLNGRAKYAIWDLVDQDVFKGLYRDGNPVLKTWNGREEDLLNEVKLPPLKMQLEPSH